VNRLRWQLTLSHLAAIAVTLVSMIAALLLIASVEWSQSTTQTDHTFDQVRTIASSMQPVILRQVADGEAGASELDGALGLLLGGGVRLAGGTGWGPLPASAMANSLDDVAYVVVAGPDGRILASSDPTGGAYAPPERAAWMPLLGAALEGTTDPVRLQVQGSAGGPAGLSAYPVMDVDGHPVAAVLVATLLQSPNNWWTPWRVLLVFGAASAALLAGASVFALASSSLVGYLLARRLVRRLERLGRAAEAFAQGDLSQRVDVEAHDEVAQLSRRFNTMADRISDTLAELSHEKDVAEAALQAKRELVANVSHELRTPLASIRGHTESLLLANVVDTQVTRSDLQVIHRQSERLSRLIDDLFLLSTSESGALPLVMRPVQIEEVVHEVVCSMQQVAYAERKVSLVSVTDPPLPAILADRQRLAQVLANLVRNAVRYTPEGGLVAVRSARWDARFAVVSVEDTGAGIAPEALERVFDRFYRADASRDRASGGAGLGLAIVRELVTAMGGETSAESVVGEGSRFSFTVPFAEASYQLEVDGHRHGSMRSSA
jgi:signal transduction histidine kinase